MHPPTGGGYGHTSYASYSIPGGVGNLADHTGLPNHNVAPVAATASGGLNGPGQAQYSDINRILDQILTVTDQSLDEAQVARFYKSSPG